MARNDALQRLDGLIGDWDLTLENAWFFDPGTVKTGEVHVDWLDDSFIRLTSTMEGAPLWNMVFGHSDAGGGYVVLYHDDRGTSRVFGMSFDGTKWKMERADSDMHQRLIGVVSADRIVCHTDASDDEGETWRKDFDFTFTRKQTP